MKYEISQRLEKWRILQSNHTPEIHETISSQNPAEVENELLFLPSYFTERKRNELSLTTLASEEKQLREGHCYECILQLRHLMKILSSIYGQKKKEIRGQKANTRARLKLDTIEAARDQILAVYNLSRHALWALGNNDEDLRKRFPILTLADLYRKSTVQKRILGDTYRPDGLIWELLGLSSGSSQSSASASVQPLASKPSPPVQTPVTDAHEVTPKASSPDTIATSTRSQLPATSSSSAVPSASSLPEEEEPEPIVHHGKLWSPVIGLTSAEEEQWEREGKSHCIIT